MEEEAAARALEAETQIADAADEEPVAAGEADAAEADEVAEPIDGEPGESSDTAKDEAEEPAEA